ncbi:MAG: glycosyltransferase family 2 protein [Butyricicoccus sp.]
MATVSLCMIVRNEEKVLARCLDSVRGIADEICITDTGSTDKTREIAQKYGTVQVFPWCDDFSAARNFSFAQARMDYTLWLDADDVLLPSDRQKLLALKAELDGTADVVMLPYHTGFERQGRPTFSVTVSGCSKRLRTSDGRCVLVHRAARGISGTGMAVTHRKPPCGVPDRNLKIYENLLARGKAGCTRQLLLRARAAGA